MNQPQSLPVAGPEVATPAVRSKRVVIVQLGDHYADRELPFLAALQESGAEVVLVRPGEPEAPLSGIERFEHGLAELVDGRLRELTPAPAKSEQDKAWYRRFERKPRYGR